MGLMETFNKQGGRDLLHQYRRSGALVTSGCEFALLGKSKKAL